MDSLRFPAYTSCGVEGADDGNETGRLRSVRNAPTALVVKLSPSRTRGSLPISASARDQRSLPSFSFSFSSSGTSPGHAKLIASTSVLPPKTRATIGKPYQQPAWRPFPPPHISAQTTSSWILSSSPCSNSTCTCSSPGCSGPSAHRVWGGRDPKNRMNSNRLFLTCRTH